MIQSAQRKAKEELSIDIDTQKLIFLGIYDDIFDESAFDAISTHCSPVTYVYRLNETEESLIAPDIQHKDLQYFDLDDTSLHAMVKIRIKDIKKLNLLNQE
jgi:8-oxo-dGTP pyrophosphatase MutT (NUDIX family)